jgi:hypothetical protein
MTTAARHAPNYWWTRPRTLCRADTTRGSRLQRCGRIVHPGLTVCIDHFDQHAAFLPSFVAAFFARFAR